jgi:hypothetical protein
VPGGLVETFVDAALGCNNPSKQMMHEIRHVLYPDSSPKIDCFLSIGTGSAPRVHLPRPAFWQGAMPTHVITALQKTAVDCYSTHQDMEMDFSHRPGVYSRFSVTTGMESIGLEEWDMMDEVRAHTLSYLKDMEVGQKLDSFVKILAQKFLNPNAEGEVAEVPSM